LPGDSTPTQSGDKSAEAKFKEITKSYEVLPTPRNRQKYDQYGDHGSTPTSSPKQPGSVWKAVPGGRRCAYTESDYSDLGDLNSIFENLYRGFVLMAEATRRHPGKPKAAEYPIEVTLEEAV